MKKFLSLVISIAMLVTLISAMSVLVSAQSEPWDGLDFEDYAGGDGTEANPYLIANGYQFSNIIIETTMLDYDMAGVFFKLTDDINLGGASITPIKKFAGVLDGNGKTIFNFNISASNAAFIQNLNDGAIIKNLKIDYATISTFGNRAAALVSNLNTGALVENCEIGSNVTVTIGVESTASPILGSVVCFGLGGTIKNVVSSASVVFEVANKIVYGGGIIGAAGQDTVIENVIFSGSVVCESDNIVEGSETVLGGIIGSLGAKKTAATIKNAINLGTVKSTGVGGIAGGVIGLTSAAVSQADFAGTIENVFNKSTSVTGNTAQGTFVGTFQKPITLGGENVFITADGLDKAIGVAAEGVEAPAATAYKTALSDVDFEISEVYGNISAAISAAMPTWNTVEDVDYDPEIHGKPEDSTPTETDPITPEDTDPITPEDTDPITPTETDPQTPVETNPQTPAQTQKPSAGTEKPADDGGCGSVIASGLAIVAVVSLAGVALAKKRD